jgi:hypothetical protein
MNEPREMIITEALTKLKTLGARIKKHISESSLIVIKTRTYNAILQDKEFKKRAEGELESINTLIKNEYDYKVKISESNHVTKIKISDKFGEMTVNQLILYKNVIEEKQILLNHLKQQFASITSESVRLREQRERNINDRITVFCGKDRKDSRLDDGIITTMAENFRKDDPIDVLDPLDVGGLIKSLEAEIEEFKEKVDWITSASNSTTTIRM